MAWTPSEQRYQEMQYRRAGRSGLQLPAIALGLWQNFGESRQFSTQRDIVLAAFDHGVTHLDLANNYGPPPGAAERVLGEVIRQDLRAHRDELVVSTKAGYTMWEGPYGDWGSRKYLLASLDQSLSRTGLDYVDVFYHHRPDPETPVEETMGALATAVSQGKALYAGISNYSPEQTRAAVEAASAVGLSLTVHQPSYSMFNRHIEFGLLDTLEELGVGAVVFSPLQQGLLTDRYLEGRIPIGSRASDSPFLDASRIDETYLAHARALNDVARGRGQTLAQLALSWVLRHSAVTSALVGASSVAQLEANLQALRAEPLTDDELRAIEPHAVHGLARR